MTATSHDHDHGAETVDDDVHENSWSANLELPEHAEDRDHLLAEALDAVRHTAPGYHVNLVTHGDHGHPETYLFDELEDALGDDVEWEYVEQCGCGGHVTRVHVQE
ncbi:MAG: CGCGG family rSAM-modified RiPP protein [Halobacterium sp.]